MDDVAGAILLAGWFVFALFFAEDHVRTQRRMQLFFRNVTFAGACIMLFAVFAGVGDAVPYTVTDAFIDLT